MLLGSNCRTFESFASLHFYFALNLTLSFNRFCSVRNALFSSRSAELPESRDQIFRLPLSSISTDSLSFRLMWKSSRKSKFSRVCELFSARERNIFNFENVHVIENSKQTQNSLIQISPIFSDAIGQLLLIGKLGSEIFFSKPRNVLNEMFEN